MRKFRIWVNVKTSKFSYESPVEWCADLKQSDDFKQEI